MKVDTQRLGLRGERIAERWLLTRGWTIVSRRFRSGHRDIDLIASKPGNDSVRTIAFVEVKARNSLEFGGPIGAVNWKKRRELCRSAYVWISRFSRPGDEYRFDIIGVLLGQGTVRVRHLENAFQVPTRS